VLLLIAVGLSWPEFDHGRPLTWLYVLWMAATTACVGALYVWMESRVRRVAAAT